MTDPEPPLTIVDPGRDALGGRPVEATTVVDPGRDRGGGEPVTVVDPGRAPVEAGWTRMLPDELARRFEILQDVTGNGQQGDVYLVRVRDSGEQRALKVHRPGWSLTDRVRDFLERHPNSHVVRVYESGTAGGRQYEVMEYLPGGTLFEWYSRQSSGVPVPVLTGLVRQLAAGLTDLHGADIVHRDIKPGNLLFRRQESPLEIVIADLGLSRQLDARGYTTTNQVGTAPYTPPEYVSGGQVLPAYDWWSLGITVMELATGEPVFAGIDNQQVLRSRIATHAIPVDEVADPRIRLLCSGLLTMNPGKRWGSREVASWLAGGSPPVDAASPSRQAGAAVEQPYGFLDQEYFQREMLAVALHQNWDAARVWLFDNTANLRQLHQWLRLFPDFIEPVDRPRRRAPDDVKLLYELRAVDPAHPPVYCGWNISPARLSQLADQAAQGIEPAVGIVTDLWREDLLPLLGRGAASGGFEGGAGLVPTRDRWRTSLQRLETLARAVPDKEANAEIRRILREDRAYALSLALLAATATRDDLRRLHRTLNEQQGALKLPWFSSLVADPAYEWVAFALIDHATRESERIADEERARLAQAAWRRRTERHREWSRRQNRPLALAYAVTGVAAVAVVLFALVGLSDVVDIVAGPGIIDAWFATVVALTVVTVSESLLAWALGGRFHPAYSLVGAGAIVLGRLAGRVLARRMALPVVLVVLGGLGGAAVFWPVVLPYALATVDSAWAVRRLLRWREQDRQEHQEQRERTNAATA